MSILLKCFIFTFFILLNEELLSPIKSADFNFDEYQKMIESDFIPSFQPTIGIISQEISNTCESKIQQSYSNFIEAGGGRVVPILLDMPNEEIYFIAKSINGVLFPGGSMKLERNSRFWTLQTFFLDYSIQQFHKGEIFPVWGTCLGFQTIAQYAANNFTMIPNSYFENWNKLLPLEWNSDYTMIFGSPLLNLCRSINPYTQQTRENMEPNLDSQSSEMQATDTNNFEKNQPTTSASRTQNLKTTIKRDLFSDNDSSSLSSDNHYFNHKKKNPLNLMWNEPMCSLKLFRAMEWLPLASHYHTNGVTAKAWEENPGLDSFLNPLAYCTGADGQRFVTLFEGKKYPIYGSQFHPEKNLYGFSPSINAQHSFLSGQITHYFASFFVNEARKNKQRFPDPTTEFDYLLFKHQIFNLPLSENVYEFLPIFKFPFDPSMLNETISINDMV